MLPNIVRDKLHPIVDLDYLEVRAQILQDRAKYF